MQVMYHADNPLTIHRSIKIFYLKESNMTWATTQDMRDERESPKTNAILQLITKSILKFSMHKDSSTYEYVVTYIAIFITFKNWQMFNK